MHSRDDRSTPARIRDAAVLRYARDGMDAPLRVIAVDAKVSPALILHHFGSSAGLKEACNEYVLQRVFETKSDVLDAQAGAAALLAQLADVDSFAPLIGYVLRSLQAGGAVSRRIVDLMARDTASYLEEGVAQGTISPSRSPEARARILTEMALGALLLHLPSGQESLELDELPAMLNTYLAEMSLPIIEMYTQPLLTDSTLLDTYLAATEGNPS